MAVGTYIVGSVQMLRLAASVPKNGGGGGFRVGELSTYSLYSLISTIMLANISFNFYNYVGQYIL
jgi:endonuclease V-like protein UPF0215 family